MRILVALALAGVLSSGCEKKKTVSAPSSSPVAPSPATPKPVVNVAPEPKPSPAVAPEKAGDVAAGVDLEALAEKLVRQCAAVQEGEIVWVQGGPRSLRLLENVAVHVRKRGAHPIVGYWSDRLMKRMFFDVPAQYDSQAPAASLKLNGMLAAEITVWSQQDDGVLADAPPERLAARLKAGEPAQKLSMDRAVRQVALGNDLYPTEQRAKRFGISVAELSKIFWGGVNVDYDKLVATGESVKGLLAAGKEVHVTNPNGTDFRVRIEGRTPFVNDGVVSEEDKKRGYAGVMAFLPAGEVYVTPVPGTANGKIVLDRHTFRGKDILGLTLVFQAGKLTSMTATSGLEPLQALYEKAGPAGGLFSVIDVGINPNVQIPPGSRLVAWMATGMVTLGMGNDTWAGGTNTNGFGVYGFIPGSTLKVDGKAIVENGQLKL